MRERYSGRHILAEGHIHSTDTWQTGLNNNILIFGPSGAGKTRSYVEPNIANTVIESMIVSETKGYLYHKSKDALEEKGYDIKVINFTDLNDGSGYNPLDYIRYDPEIDRFNEQDILSLARCLVPDTMEKDPYWTNASRQFLSCLIMYVLEALPEEEHTLEYVIRLFNMIGSEEMNMLIREIELFKPGSSLPERYKAIKSLIGATATMSGVKGVLSSYLDPLGFDSALALYRNPDKIDLTSFGRKKTALFITISDTDRSMDNLASALMTQIMQQLCMSADRDFEDHMLEVPVRMYLDDFATNLYIPDFDKIISVIRSREIYVSVILQSITQLESLYGSPRASTIINNCDRQLYLGGQDVSTAKYISERTNKPLNVILDLPLDNGFVLVRGQKPEMVRKYSPDVELGRQK